MLTCKEYGGRAAGGHRRVRRRCPGTKCPCPQNLVPVPSYAPSLLCFYLPTSYDPSLVPTYPPGVRG
eukprot:1420530-Rhodomonas_salina.1